ncbi:MAG: Eco57I restriction-modification methylase domain-containing protein [Phascolarctobacterium sp.]|nr:Eco57I restriction-modification methylase domain-containing protein [Phascolarctobacterium sp.]
MADNLFDKVYNPDVLSCLANLSNDEVFTPPDVANKMLDMLPQELFSNPNTTFLDPACKSGIFLREIAKRLIKGLEKEIPDLQERLDHIFHKQLYGIAITEMTSLLSRRSVYCSKYPNSKYSASKFDDVEGNIRYRNIAHTWVNGKCKYCGAAKSEYGGAKRKGLETHAYEFIHTINPEEIFNMKFDVIIGNPPYQLSDGGAQASASPLYHHFVNKAKKLSPEKYLIMIIPARWYAGGKGLDYFRDEMLEDIHIKELHDFPVTDDCFPGVNIRGGVCYFLWDKHYDNRKSLTKVVTHNKNKEVLSIRPLKYDGMDIFIRSSIAFNVLEKVKLYSNDNMLDKYVSPRKPFGLSTDFTRTIDFYENRNRLKHPLVCYGKGFQVGYVEESLIKVHKEWVPTWKIMTSRANNIGTELNDDNLNTYVAKPGEICTESYLLIGVGLDLDEETCKNLAAYLKTKFARFCHSLAKSSQDATAKTYRFIPLQDFTKPWTDEELYKKYNLTDDEIAFIESMIKPMDLGSDVNG